LLQKKIIVKDFICLDVGASTGGFTQVLLQHGAKKIIALDVGTSQLHETLRAESRVISIENTDIRNVKLEDKFDIIVVDVSFISLRKIIPTLIELKSENTELILLFKPQFEV
jgi:23S rRNA (cytidine1920-2'-O)/16S rRNA (cytidine1409-2'-O)-methyltransferase